MKFERDPKKAGSNLKKHGVSFEAAVTVFYNPFRLPLTIQTIPSPKLAL